MSDTVNHPEHYQQVPGIECIDVVEHFSFLRGNAIKYLWRAGAKGDTVEDLRKAVWYIEREIASIDAARVTEHRISAAQFLNGPRHVGICNPSGIGWTTFCGADGMIASSAEKMDCVDCKALMT